MKHTHARSFRLHFRWPDPPFEIALIEPEIPPNTGNIARLCAATGTILHLVGQLGFRLTNASLRRAGLDYWESVDIRRHDNIDAFLESAKPERCFFFTAAGKRSFYEADYQPGNVLVFGCESKGLPDNLLKAYPAKALGIPMLIDSVRSLNLATAAAIALFEALRQVQQPFVSAISP